MVTVPPPSPFPSVPPLASGDRLSRAEFERRYASLSDGYKAELIEGVVYMAAAARFRSHGKPHGNLTGWLWTYMVATTGVELGIEPTIRLDFGNEPQPDAVLMIEPDRAGQARISDDDYIEGAPELVAEIAASSVAIDSQDKLRAYQRNGVQEYLIWRVFDRQLDWFALQDGVYVPLPIDPDGVIRSRVFPGLWLAVDALLAGKMPSVLTTVQTGIASEAHAVFLHQLHSASCQ